MEYPGVAQLYSRLAGNRNQRIRIPTAETKSCWGIISIESYRWVRLGHKIFDREQTASRRSQPSSVKALHERYGLTTF